VHQAPIRCSAGTPISPDHPARFGGRTDHTRRLPRTLSGVAVTLGPVGSSSGMGPGWGRARSAGGRIGVDGALAYSHRSTS